MPIVIAGVVSSISPLRYFNSHKHKGYIFVACTAAFVEVAVGVVGPLIPTSKKYMFAETQSSNVTTAL